MGGVNTWEASINTLAGSDQARLIMYTTLHGNIFTERGSRKSPLQQLILDRP